jgi:hypothetical protein
MKRYPIGYAGPDVYAALTEGERLAWFNPDTSSYHHFFLERMGLDVFRLRDSNEPFFYVGSHFELTQHIWSKLTLRRISPGYEERVTALRLLSAQEVDDLLSDL